MEFRIAKTPAVAYKIFIRNYLTLLVMIQLKCGKKMRMILEGKVRL